MSEILYILLWAFFIYSFLGWCMEELFVAITSGEYINRGFLTGPWCPIYGIGMILLILLLVPLRENTLMLFVGSFMLMTLLELVTGFILDAGFHSQWWNYSDKPFQFHGYICLQFSLCWGLLGSFVILEIQEKIFGLINFIPYRMGHILLLFVIITFITDCCFTVCAVLNLEKRIKALDMVSNMLRKIYVEIGKTPLKRLESFPAMASSVAMILGKGGNKLKETSEKLYGTYQAEKEKMHSWNEAHREEAENLHRAGHRAFSGFKVGEERLLKAFPKVRFFNHEESLEKYKDYVLEEEKPEEIKETEKE